jgi:hypothetical protein
MVNLRGTNIKISVQVGGSHLREYLPGADETGLVSNFERRYIPAVTGEEFQVVVSIGRDTPMAGDYLDIRLAVDGVCVCRKYTTRADVAAGIATGRITGKVVDANNLRPLRFGELQTSKSQTMRPFRKSF